MKSTFVHPLSPEVLAKVRHFIQDDPMRAFLFDLLVNNGLRTGDVLKLKLKQIRKLQVGDSVMLRESKTGKQNFLFVNQLVYESLQKYLAKYGDRKDDQFVFSRWGHIPWRTGTVGRWLKEICAIYDKDKKYGAHTPRKTFVRLHYDRGVPLGTLQFRLNHSTPAMTLRYATITPTDVRQVLNFAI